MPLSSYLTRLIWLCVLPLVLFSAWLVYGHVRTLQMENEQEASYIAHNFAMAIDHHLNARVGALTVLASTPMVQERGRLPDLYQAAQHFRKNFGSHVVLSDGMQMLFHTRAPLGADLPPLPKPKGNSAVARALATGQPAIGDIVFGPIAQESLVTIAVPVQRQNQPPLILLAIFETQLFQNRLESIALPADWNLALLDSQGDVIARRFPLEPVPAFKQITVSLSVTSWTVSLDIPRERYVAPLAMAGITLGLGAIAALLLGIGGGLWGTRRLGTAVASLTRNDSVHQAGPDIEEIAAVRQRIDADNQRITSFAASQDRAIEQERRRVAREVHDQMGQVFTAIKLIIQSIPRNAFPSGQEAALNQALEMGIFSARKITAELRPPLLDDLGLVAAIDHFGREISRTSGLECETNVLDVAGLCAEQSLGLFRIVQEAVTNVLRHAGATRIRIDGRSEGGDYQMRIEDDGCGFNPASIRPGAQGLTNMQERARLMHGTCQILPRPGDGTCVFVTLPLDKSIPGNTNEHPAA